MAAGDPILNYSDLILYATSAGEQIPFFKGPRISGVAATTPVAGRVTSFWRYDGQPGGATAIPTAAATCTNTTPGALGQASPTGSAKKRLVSITAGGFVPGTLILYDRLVHSGGLDATVTTAQTVSTPTLTRRTSGVGVEAAFEIYTQIGATITTASVSYTNNAGTAGQVSPIVSIGSTGFREGERMLPIPLLTGDKGVRAIATATLTATTGTAGNFGITLLKRLAVLPLSASGVGDQWNAVLKPGGPIDLDGDACLAWMWLPNGAIVPEVFGMANFLEK